MAKIPLRAYLKDIEQLIEHGEIDQAVAHAMNILRSYPKHIDTYRLLGKAYLESQRYSEAADILQRVLSVIPDDFISQIGMSIIREDENNLDAAIWHMERAYEVQPFNPAVQTELRRLYGRRDGIEPPKIRLTRGALVRMYTRGALYPQAIAEIRAALAEDPQRLDLRVLLARVYYLAGHKNDAAEVCSDLINKLPYCLEANRLLADILPTTSRAEEAKKFQQRIFALDPYAAFISPSAPTSDQVPEQAVMVEQLVWDPSMQGEQAPDWTRTVGVNWEGTEEENLPDWLNTLNPEATPAPSENTLTSAASVSDEAVAEPGRTEENAIPDWMREAGWTPADRTADEIMASQSDTEPAGDQVAPAEIPDWLQAMAPAEADQPSGVEPERDTWLESLLTTPGSTNGKEAGAAVSPEQAMPGDQEEQRYPDSSGPIAPEPETSGFEQIPEESQTPAEDMPEWFVRTQEEPPVGAPREQDESGDLVEQAGAGLPETDSQVTGEEEMPDWMRTIGQESEETPLSQEMPGLSDSTSGVPDWLEAFASETGETTGEKDSELPDWLSSLGESESLTTEATEPEAGLPQDEMPVEKISTSWQPETTESNQDQAPAQEQPAQMEPAVSEMPDPDSTMAWLESQAARQGADEETLTTPPGDRREESPVWPMKEIETGETAPIDVGTAEAGEAIEALDGQTIEKPEATLPETQATGIETPAPQETVGLEDAAQETWGEEIMAQAPETETAEVQGAQDAGAREEVGEVEELPDWLQENEQIEPTQPVQTASSEMVPPDLSDMDAAMAWLEALAARQGADEETLVTPPEQRQETPPDWILKEMDTGEEIMPEMAAQADTTDQAETATSAEAEAPDQEEPAAQPAEEIPDWMKDTLEIRTASLGETGLLEEAELSEAQALPEETAETSVPAESMDSAFAWLESLAAKQGAEEETLITPPEERSETPPDWVTREQESVQNVAAVENSTPASIEDAAAFSERTGEAVSPIDELPGQGEVPAHTESMVEPEKSVIAQAEESNLSKDATAEEIPFEETHVEATEAETADVLPDWLASLSQEEETDQIAGDQVSAESVELRSEEESAWPTDDDTHIYEEEAVGEALPDWLQGLEIDQPAVPEPAARQETVPEWLVGLEEEGELENPPVETAGETPPVDFHSAWAPESDIAQAPQNITEQILPASFIDYQAALQRGDLEKALDGYNRYIQDGEHLDEMIHDLRDALYRYPVDIGIWQALGDAYARNDQLQEALDAYTKAEELLR